MAGRRTGGAYGLAVLAHPLEEGFADAGKVLAEARRALRRAGLAVHGPAEPITDIRQADMAGARLAAAGVSCVVLLPATWSDDFLATRILARTKTPAVAWGTPGVSTGSLCGAQQIASVLAELDVPCRFVHGDPGDASAARRAAGFARVCALRDRLRLTRIGLIGGRTHGMTEIAVDEIGLHRVWGVELYAVPMHRFEQQAKRPAKAEAAARWTDAKRRAERCEVDDAAGREAVSAAMALEAWMDEHLCDAVAVDCYPDRMGVFCLAASLLAESGKIVACEADAHAALVQLVLADLTGQPTHNTDLLHVDREEDTILVGHCGSGALELADPEAGATLSPVRLAKSGCCVRFPARPGPVTLVNLVGREDTYRLTIIEGEAVRTGMDFAGNPLRIRLPVSADSFLETVAEHGAGHHWIAGCGHVASQVEDLAALVGVAAIRIG